MTEPEGRSPGLKTSNYDRGLLVDDEWMAGVAREPDASGSPGEFVAFVVDHGRGALIARQRFADAESAVAALNRLPRAWRFEATAGCAGDRCAEGKCKGSACKIFNG